MVKILIADDDREDAQEVAWILDAHGYSASLAKDGEETLQKAREEHPDVIIMDILMPRFDGTEVAIALRDNAKTRHIPIIFVTGLKNHYDNVGLSLAENSLVLAKPVIATELLAALKLLRPVSSAA